MVMDTELMSWPEVQIYRLMEQYDAEGTTYKVCVKYRLDVQGDEDEDGDYYDDTIEFEGWGNDIMDAYTRGDSIERGYMNDLSMRPDNVCILDSHTWVYQLCTDERGYHNTYLGSDLEEMRETWEDLYRKS